MDIFMSSGFPENEFRAFGLAAHTFFPELLSIEDQNDPLDRLWHFDRAWQAVRYRYRLCGECSEEFRSLLANASESWRADAGDEELTYKLERCIYVFFMSGLSVFESLGFCLYFLGSTLQPKSFPHIAKPKKITLPATTQTFATAFPQATITQRLAELPQKPEFITLDEVRNLLAHRTSGRRRVVSSGILHRDSTGRPSAQRLTREETWALPGLSGKLSFDEEMLQRHLDAITGLLTTLASASREFAEGNQSAKAGQP